MTLGLISDIHGNYPALLSVLEKLDSLGVKEVVCLGDTAGYYPMVNECISELRKRGIRSVMGNHDWYLAGGICIRSRVVTTCIEYQKTIITEENLQWLQSLPLELKIDKLRIVHGGWSDPIDEYLDPKPGYFQNLEGSFFASGHSHIPQIFIDGNKTWCNPGSVGQPRDNNPDAAFGVFDESSFQIYRSNYDVASIIRECKVIGLPEKTYGGLAVGSQNLVAMAEVIQNAGNHD